jgi:hypothetical protein
MIKNFVSETKMDRKRWEYGRADYLKWIKLQDKLQKLDPFEKDYEFIPEISKATQALIFQELRFFENKAKYNRYDADPNFSNYAFRVLSKMFASKCNTVTMTHLMYTYYYGIVTERDEDNNLTIKNTRDLSWQILACMKSGVEKIIIPVNNPRHQNLILYLSETNTFEYFEPHKIYSGKDYDFEDVKSLITYFIEGLVLRKIIPANPTIIWPVDLCYLGIQNLERSYTYKNGLCQVWAHIYLYFRLKYPDTEWKYIEKFMFENEELTKYLADGFITFILEESRKDIKDEKLEFVGTQIKSKKLGSLIAKDYVESLGMPIPRKDKLCINLKTASSEDLLDYLLKDTDNVVIGIDDDFYCLDKSHWYTKESLIPVIPGFPYMTNRSNINYILSFPEDIRFFAFEKIAYQDIYKLKKYYTLDEYILSG